MKFTETWLHEQRIHWTPSNEFIGSLRNVLPGSSECVNINVTLNCLLVMQYDRICTCIFSDYVQLDFCPVSNLVVTDGHEIPPRAVNTCILHQLVNFWTAEFGGFN